MKQHDWKSRAIGLGLGVAVCSIGSAGAADVTMGSGENAPTYAVSGAKETKLVLGGYVQENAEFGNPSAYEGQWTKPIPGGGNSEDTRFRLRRARLGAWGNLSDDFDFKIMGDFAQGDGLTGGRQAMSGTDIYINWHTLPELNIKVGQFDTPFGMEQFSIPDMMILTPERSQVTEALRVERQIGAMVWGKPLATVAPDNKDLLAYYVGAFNGNNRNVSINDNNSMMYMARLETMPFKGALFGMPSSWKLGVDGYYSEDGTNTLVTQVGNAWVQKDGSLKPMFVQDPNKDKRTAGGVDQIFTCGPLTIQAEYLQTKYQGTLTKVPTFTASGYWALVGYQIIPNTVELVGKYEYFKPDQAPDDDLNTITGGINWYIKGRDIVLMVDYMHTTSHFREMNPSFGTDTFDEVLARMQFNF